MLAFFLRSLAEHPQSLSRHHLPQPHHDGPGPIYYPHGVAYTCHKPNLPGVRVGFTCLVRRRLFFTPLSLTRFRRLIHGQQHCLIDIQVRLCKALRASKLPDGQRIIMYFWYGFWLSEVRRIPPLHALCLLTVILQCVDNHPFPGFVHRSCPFSILSIACNVSVALPLIPL